MANTKKAELIKLILENANIDYDEEEMIDILLEEKVAANIEEVHTNTRSFGDKMADNLASFAGSWVFIISFMVTLFIWIGINVYLFSRAFDPFPFILLNLILSCIAAIQAPVIMMSQNRQEEKDRLRAKNDYKVNLKAELIVEDLHKKIDTLMNNQLKILNKIDELEKK